jgi:putative YphP/YqiW family bacilliredoxin
MMFNINQNAPTYDPVAVQPMRDELIYVGFEEALTPIKVEEMISNQNDATVLFFINSVCGCAAGSARPGIALALQNKVIPDKLVTVFAGQDKEAVNFLRSNYLSKYPPSSPFIALFKFGELLRAIPRNHIEGRSAEEIASDLKEIFYQNCIGKGPSISKEKYDELISAKMCGSKIPLA